MKDRRIVESGTHLSLLATSSTYSQLMTDFAGSRPDDEGANDGVNLNKVTKGADAHEGAGEGQSAKGTGKLIQHEARKTGSIGVQVYAGYLHAGRGAWTFPLTLAMAGIMQAAQVMSTYVPPLVKVLNLACRALAAPRYFMPNSRWSRWHKESASTLQLTV